MAHEEPTPAPAGHPLPRVVGIVPARGGSKGVPGKNLKHLCGRPLLSYTLEAACNSKLLQHVAVTSDDEAILDVAREFAEVSAVPRPPALATDEASVVPALLHALEALEASLALQFDIVALLQPTAPLREPWHIDEAIGLLARRSDAQSVISVTAMHEVHPARMYWLPASGNLDPIMPAHEQSRRQSLPAAYYRNGSIYLVRASALREQQAVMAKPAIGYAMDARYLLNIDEPRDWVIAEALMREHVGGR